MNYQRLIQLIERDVTSVLDIGAHFGDFTKELKNRMPFADYYMIEGNAECEAFLQELKPTPYKIALLSDTEKEVVYYKNKTNLTSTGNSYYRENTEHFSDDNILAENTYTQTLDNLFTDRAFDLIKLDTQGSEIDIMKGGQTLVSKAKYVLLECSVQEYNQGAPLVEAVKEYMAAINFKPLETIGEHHHNGVLMQQDILFRKAGL